MSDKYVNAFSGTGPVGFNVGARSAVTGSSGLSIHTNERGANDSGNWKVPPTYTGQYNVVPPALPVAGSSGLSLGIKERGANDSGEWQVQTVVTKVPNG